jgi:hypothetical protein
MHAVVVSKPKTQNFRAYLSDDTRDRLAAFLREMGSSDTVWAERMAIWFLELPEATRMRLWRGHLPAALLKLIDPTDAGAGVGPVAVAPRIDVPDSGPLPEPPARRPAGTTRRSK